MNQKKAKELRKSILFDTKAERTYTRDPKFRTLYVNVERQRSQRLKKEYKNKTK